MPWITYVEYRTIMDYLSRNKTGGGVRLFSELSEMMMPGRGGTN